MRRALALALFALALMPGVAHAVTSATGVIAGQDLEYTLTVRNTGDEAIQCIRFVASSGVVLQTVNGPGTINFNPGTNTFGAQGNPLIPVGGQAVWTFTTQQPYPTDSGGQLRISPNCVADFAGEVSGPAAAPPPGPQPVVGQTEVAHLVSGTVLIRVRGSNRFVRLTADQAIPDGSEIDTKKGTVRLTLAQPDGTTETADISEGRAIVDQSTGNPAITTLRLSEPLTGCGTARAAAKKKKRPKQRQLFVSTKGHVRTQGRYAAAIATGTAWRTVDRCTSTTIQVVEGAVSVTDLRSKRSAPLRAPARRVVRRP